MLERLFLEMKGEHAWFYEPTHGFTTEDGKHVQGFWNRRTHRTVHVYLNEKGILMPYFRTRSSTEEQGNSSP